MINKSIILLLISLISISCSKEPKNKLFIPSNIVIAHRGSTFYTPEETEAAYRWARNLGADYLEVDIQRSKDGVLLALHDDALTRTTNIETVFPQRKLLTTSQFTFEELMKLDAGSWFNSIHPKRAHAAYAIDAPIYETTQVAITFDSMGNKVKYKKNDKVYFGGKQGVSVLEDVIRIAEGYRIAKDSLGNRLYEKVRKNGEVEYQFFYIEDIVDNGHRPGVYIETKEPQLFPNIEKDLFYELDRLGWNNATKPTNDTIAYRNAKVRIGETSAKIILQTFSPHSLKNLNSEFKEKVPICFLLWLGDPNMLKNDSLYYFKNLKFAKENGAQIIGPSIGGEPNNYNDLLTNDNYRWIKREGFLIHPYSFNIPEQTRKYGKYSDGMFTDRADLTLEYYIENGLREAIRVKSR